jgi:hypothetical protein
VTGLVGCRSTQLGYDQRNMRETLLELYQNQVLDNLVRTKKNLPIVHIDYGNLNGTITQEASLSAGDDLTSTNQGFAAGAAGALLKRVRTAVLKFSGGAKHTNQLTLNGSPVITSNAVYQAYAAAAADDVIKPMTTPLKDGEAHLTYRFQNETWYVPDEKKDAFFELYLKTTVKRQAQTTIVAKREVFGAEKISEKSGRSQLEIKLKESIPNDSGTLTVNIDGRERIFRYKPVPDVPIGHPTDRILLDNPEAETKMSGTVLAQIIKGKVATLTNDTPVLLAVPTVDPLEAIRFQLEQQRLQQLTR